jgi:hypothetical protein
MPDHPNGNSPLEQFVFFSLKSSLKLPIYSLVGKPAARERNVRISERANRTTWLAA